MNMRINGHDFYAQYDRIVADFASNVEEGQFSPNSVPVHIRQIKQEMAGLFFMEGGSRLTFPQMRELFGRLNAIRVPERAT
jgi:hypothetical protein